MTHYVYVMDDGVHRKIGFSNSPHARAKQVRRSAEVRVVFEIEVEAHHLVERAAHLKLSERRVEGEWFDVSIEEAIEAVQWAIENPLEPKTASQLVKESRERVVAKGGGYIPRTLLPREEFALWLEFKGDSTVQEAIVRLMNAQK